ncbi:MAG: DMT family transporter [Alistipes sp.]|nr:DMT family transporter [Alistipes sp.]
MKSGKYYFHIIALLAVAVWGATFVSSKILLNNGLSATEIFIYRFLMAYAAMWIFASRRLFANNVKDELLMAVVGFTGGSLYFIFENTAIDLGAPLSNVSLLVATAPIWTALLTKIIYPKEKMGANLWVGMAIAFAGCALVIFNGRFTLDISNPGGHVLALAAAVSWAVYSLVIKALSGRYSPVFITRKVFFYGVLTAIPFMYIPLTGTGEFNLAALTKPAVWGNLAFLGLVASMACFALWNVVIKKIGIVKSSNYLYLSPIFTIIASAMFVDEQITWVAVGGFVLIIGGLWIAERGLQTHNNEKK